MQRVVTSVSIWLAFGGLMFLSASAACAQVQSPDGTDLYAGDFVKGVAQQFPVVGNRWNILRLRLSNTHEREVDLQVAIYFDVDRALQYSRRVRIPPKTNVVAWLPVRLPGPEHLVDRGFAYHILVRSYGDATGLIPDESGSLQLDQTLQVESNEPATGIFHTPPLVETLDTEVVERKTATAFEFMMTGRYARGLRQNWKTLFPGFASGKETGLQALDHLVLANDELLDDSAGQDAVRRWLFGGGRLWVMLDRVDARILELLLGDVYQGQELERVELTHVELADSSGQISATFDYEDPIEMIRLLIDDVDLEYTVDGWPAAFWIDYGQGRVLVTTIGAEAWVIPRRPTDPPPDSGGGWQTEFVPGAAYRKLTMDFYKMGDPPPEVRSVLSAQMNEYIGFRIPDRWSVTGVLAVYTLLCSSLGVWLWKRGRLSLFGVLGPVLAVSAAMLLLAMRPAGRDIPQTAVIAQLVTPITGTDDVRARGVAGLYSSDSSPFEMSGNAHGWLFPDMEGFRRGIRTLTYDDRLSWQWEKLESQPGLHNAIFEWSGEMEPVEAVATFNEGGLTGTLRLPEQLEPEDAILDTGQGRIGVTLNRNGEFEARTSDTLSREQFLAADLLEDEQRRRIAVLQQLLEPADRPWNSQQPHLLFWTEPWSFGFEFGERVQCDGSALVAVPLKLVRPPGGSRITVPAPLLRYREVQGPDGKVPAGIYSYKQREWLNKRFATSTWLGFDVPDVLLPLTIDRVDLQIAVTGSLGQLEFFKWDGSGLVSLRQWDNPVGTLTLTLDASDGLSISDDGKILLFLSAGSETFDAGEALEEPRSPWRIESLDLTLEATVLEPES